jgi:3'(2'), 5'-bisphosphate nucleotidase
VEPVLGALREVTALARRAGVAILEVYEAGAAGAGVTVKDDRSPLTLADRRSHEVIAHGLTALTPDIPVVSEEGDHGAAAGAALRWVVDPLDGTKEFIKRSGEFTVNIALVLGDRPVAGVVHAPVTGDTWVGGVDGAERIDRAGSRVALRTTRPGDASRPRIVASRDHAGPAVRALLDRFPGAETLSIGSSLKFCLVAEGRADLYLRDGPTMEWDTAAAHAVLRAAGGAVRTLDGAELAYGKPGLRNPFFVAVGDPAFAWGDLIGTVQA